MGRMDRGDTTKLAIRLSIKAAERIDRISKNVNLSRAGVILFALSERMKEPPGREELLRLEQNIVLEPKNFTLTVTREFNNRLAALAEQYSMSERKDRKNKNVVAGLLVSDYYERMETGDQLLQEHEEAATETQNMHVIINEELKKKIIEYSERNYISISGVVSMSILAAKNLELPRYTIEERGRIATRIPVYIWNKVKHEANERNIPDNFYIEMCLYRAFMGERGLFIDKRISPL